MLRKSCLIAAAFTALAGVVAGCNNASDPMPVADPTAAKSPPAPGAEAQHGHKSGQHGGTIVEIGSDNYHAEAIFEKDGVVRLFTLGKDEARVEEVETQTLTAYAKPTRGGDAAEFQLKPAPEAGDAAGKTSRFVGTLPNEMWGKPVEVTVPSIRIGGARFRFGFSSAPAEAHVEGVPAKVTNDEERKLYLTPGGKYTAADIAANGNQTASERFKGLMASHDLQPKAGDKICPITLTKANPTFSWVVGGKSYEFCCPPCVDEFVKTAKEQPDQVKEPGDYVKKP